MNTAEQKAIDQARNRPCCELCGTPNRDGLQAAHALTRGMGGSHDVNHPWNLLGLCLDCHQAQHSEGVLGILFRLIARREGRSVEEIRDKVRELRNSRKAPSA